MSIRRSTRAVALAASALVLTVLPLGGVANAAATCSYNTTTKIVSVNLGPVSAATTIQRASSSAGAALQVNGTNCSTATVDNTDKVIVSGTNNDHTLTLNLANGLFTPGFTPEPNPADSEIEFDVSISGTGAHTVVVQGGGGVDGIRAGGTEINLNPTTETAKDDDVKLIDLGSGTRKLRVLGGGGNDVLGTHGGSGTPVAPPAYPYDLEGGDGDDKMTVGGGSGQSIKGGIGNDQINNVGTTAGLTLLGEDGNDVLRAGAPGLTLDGGIGDDQLIGGDGIDTLLGGAGFDKLEGRAAGDTLNGGADDDAMEPGLGLDTVNGGGGIADTIKYVTENGVDVNLTTGSKTGADGDTITATENVTGSPGIDAITGSALNNKLTGGGSGDVINGLDGNDNVQGGGGDDELRGGANDDTVGGGAGDDFVDGGTGVDICSGGPGTDNVQNCP